MILFLYKGNIEPNNSEALSIKAIEFYCSKKGINPYGEDGKVTLLRDDSGKPMLPEALDVHISVSHSGVYWACGIQDRPLGVDIEAYEKRSAYKLSLSSKSRLIQQRYNITNPFGSKASSETWKTSQNRILKIANRFFNDDEINYINNHGNDAFYQIWVRKEAYIKYIGKGLSFGLKNVAIIQNDGFVQKFSDAYIDEILTNETFIGAYCSTCPLYIEETVEFI